MINNNFVQIKPFSLWKNTSIADENELQQKLFDLGIKLEIHTGHLFYAPYFNPLALDFELLFVRHGETYGNCGQSSSDGRIDNESVQKNIKNKEQRIFQGNVDSEINQLTDQGKKQALAVAERLKTDFFDQDWIPDIILISPLTRAKETALPLIQQYQLQDRCFIHEGIREMSFGSWDNKRVCDFHTHDSCHLFYRTQHALVKSSGRNDNGLDCQAENFCDVLLRAQNVLLSLNKDYAGKKILMFSHSMFGAACCILLGKGQTIENGMHLAFDGKRQDGTYYTLPNAIPFSLNFEMLQLPKKLK